MLRGMSDRRSTPCGPAGRECGCHRGLASKPLSNHGPGLVLVLHIDNFLLNLLLANANGVAWKRPSDVYCLVHRTN